MARRQRGLMVAVVLAGSVAWAGSGPVVAEAATTGESAGVVAVVGDSLLVQARDRVPHRVWARNSRELAHSQKLLRRITRITDLRVLVIALGTVDVAAQIPAAEMRTRLDHTLAEVAPVPCLLFVNVKVAGVSHWYNQNWERDATRWNESVLATGQRVADWDRVAQQHPEYFIADGMHFTPVGIEGYADFIAGQVSTQCPDE